MIELSRICKSYRLPRGGRRDVLRDVSITFRPGVNMGILAHRIFRRIQRQPDRT